MTTAMANSTCRLVQPGASVELGSRYYFATSSATGSRLLALGHVNISMPLVLVIVAILLYLISTLWVKSKSAQRGAKTETKKTHCSLALTKGTLEFQINNICASAKEAHESIADCKSLYRLTKDIASFLDMGTKWNEFHESIRSVGCRASRRMRRYR
jgi:hypothetical protein